VTSVQNPNQTQPIQYANNPVSQQKTAVNENKNNNGNSQYVSVVESNSSQQRTTPKSAYANFDGQISSSANLPSFPTYATQISRQVQPPTSSSFSDIPPQPQKQQYIDIVQRHDQNEKSQQSQSTSEPKQVAEEENNPYEDLHEPHSYEDIKEE